MNQNSVLDIIYGYQKDCLYDEDIRELIHSGKSFILGDIYTFILINDEYEIHVNGKVYTDEFQFFIDFDNDFDSSIYQSSFSYKKAVENNDFDALMKYAHFNKGSIFVYDKIEKNYELFKTDNHMETIKLLVEYKVPFRYVEQDYECSNIFYINNIDGVYKLHDPFFFSTPEDIPYLDIFKLIQTT